MFIIYSPLFALCYMLVFLFYLTYNRARKGSEVFQDFRLVIIMPSCVTDNICDRLCPYYKHCNAFVLWHSYLVILSPFVFCKLSLLLHKRSLFLSFRASIISLWICTLLTMQHLNRNVRKVHSNMCFQRNSDQPAHSCSLIRIFIGRILDSTECKVTLCGQQILWSDCADSRDDLSIRWAHVSEWTFTHVAAHLTHCRMNTLTLYTGRVQFQF